MSKIVFLTTNNTHNKPDSAGIQKRQEGGGG